MRIRMRSQSVAVTTPLPQPISFEYQPGLSPLDSQGRFGGPSIDHSQDAECSNIQAKTNRGLEDHEERGVESPRFDVSAGPPTLDSLRLSDVHVEEDRDGALSGPRVEDDTVVPDKLRWRQASPKRRRIEHESRLLFEVLTCFGTEVFYGVTNMQLGTSSSESFVNLRAISHRVRKFLPP